MNRTLQVRSTHRQDGGLFHLLAASCDDDPVCSCSLELSLPAKGPFAWLADAQEGDLIMLDDEPAVGATVLSVRVTNVQRPHDGGAEVSLERAPRAGQFLRLHWSYPRSNVRNGDHVGREYYFNLQHTSTRDPLPLVSSWTPLGV